MSFVASPGVFRTVAGLWSSPRRSQVARLSAFSPASLALQDGFAFILLLPVPR